MGGGSPPPLHIVLPLDLLLLKYDSIQNAITDNIQILQYLITRGIHMLKDVVLQHKSEEYALIKFQQARIPKEL